jgi:4-diphosphocytidyl-2-C-methyl-D-erythritol kinase
MLYFPPAKINLGLHVINRRNDGFHDIETVFYQIPLFDILEIMPFSYDLVKFSGLTIEGGEGENLIEKALKAFRNEMDIPPVYIHLHKQIPIGAGLGGGSSDATYTLSGLNEVFDLKLSSDNLGKIASELGSDCSLFLKKEAQLGKGKGNELSDMPVSLSGKYLVLINPGIHVSTKEAYSRITPTNKQLDWVNVLKQPLSYWHRYLDNDFETPIFQLYPEISAIKDCLIYLGAEFALMSGSGSSVFGLFENKPNLSGLFGKYFIFESQLP